MTCGVCPICGRPKDCDQKVCPICELQYGENNMAEGYRKMARENLELAEACLPLAWEVIHNKLEDDKVDDGTANPFHYEQ